MTVYQATRAIHVNATDYALGATVPTVTVDLYRLDELGVVQEVPPAVLVPLVGVSAASTADVAAATAVEVAARNAAIAAQHTVDNGTYVSALMPQKYGAVGNTLGVSDGVTTNGSPTFTSAATTFTVADVGKMFMAVGAGPSNTQLTTTILAFVDAHTVTLAANASASLTGVPAQYGTDDTAGIDAAFAAAVAADAPVSFPGGKRYFYNGAGLGANKPRVYADAGADAAIIVLGTNKSLIVSPGGGTPAGITTLDVRDIHTIGGFGLIRLTYTGPQSGTSQFQATGINVDNFTGAGISALSSDTPFWKIQGIMHGAKDASTIGVAIDGLTDQADIDVDFLGCRVDVKLGHGGCNARIRGCHVAFSAYTTFPRIAVWVVPHTNATNAGEGLVCNEFKFGNESHSANDYHVLYADADAATGADFATRFPSYLASTGYITGHSFDEVNVSGAGAGGSVVYSTTPNVRGCRYSGLLSGALPDFILGFLTAPPADRQSTDNVVGPWYGIGLGTETALPPKPCSAPGIVRVIDPAGLFDADPAQRLSLPVGDPVDYVKLMPTLIRAFSSLAGVTRANVADAYGGTDATEITCAAGTALIQEPLTLANVTVGVPVWVEFDAKAGSTSPLTFARVYLQYTSSGAIHFRRSFAPPASGWARHRFLWVPREKSAAILLGFDANNGAGGTIQIGRVRAYHAREPLNVDGYRLTGGVIGVPPASADVQVFSAGGTWTKPLGAKFVKISAIGGGAGGGSGRKGAAGTVRCGGGGGAGGSGLFLEFAGADLPATIAVSVGGGGAGGAAQATNSTDGVAGGNGGTSQVVIGAATFQAAAAVKGNGGSATAGAGGNATVGAMAPGVAGGSASASGGAGGTVSPLGTSTAQGGCSGGAGGGIPVGNTFSAGGFGGYQSWASNAGINGGATDGAAGQAGTAFLASQAVGNYGGGGGASSVLTNGGAGAVGSFPGGGGGGGGAAVDAVGNSGAGGAGGAGVVVITTYF